MKIKKMLKRIALISIVFCICVGSTPKTSATSLFKPEFELKSEAVYFVNTDTGNVVYEKNPDKQIVPASLVKMMTVIIALETADKDDMQTFLNQNVQAKRYVFDRLFGLNASSADIRPDEVLPMKDLLYAAMLPSACEATMILADYVDGENTDAFVARMNDKAKQLGMNDTVFADPDGIDEQTQRSTAKDMYTLTEYCMKNETFKEIALTQQYMMSATNKHSQQRRVQHTNHMTSKFLGGKAYDSRVSGVKTGTAAGVKNLISTAQDSNYHYTLVTMGAPDNGTNPQYWDALNLYDWAFDNLKFVTVGKPGEKMITNNIKVKMGKDTDSVILTPKDQVVQLLPKSIDPSAVIWDTSSLPSEINAPIEKGQSLGEVSIKLSDTVLGKVEVIADKEVKRNWIAYITNVVKDILTSWIFWLVIVLVVASIIIFYFMRKQAKEKKYKRNLNKRRSNLKK